MVPAAGTSGIITSAVNQFTADRSMFIILRFKYLSRLYLTMSATYGVLPVPKYSTDQQEYRTNAQQSISLWRVPVDVVSSEISTAVLTHLGYDSHRLVIEAHYEQLLKVRYVKDSTSGYMIDLIYNSIWMNFDMLYNEALGESVSGAARKTLPAFIFRTMAEGEPSNIARWWVDNSGLTGRLTTLLNGFFGIKT